MSKEQRAAGVEGELPWPAPREEVESSDEREQGAGLPELARSDAAALALPAALAVVYGALVAVFGASLLDTGQAWPAGALAFALLAALFAAAAWGTVRLHDDARAVAASSDDWRPNPWWYVGGGGAVLCVLRAVQFLVDGRSVPDPVPVFAGTAVVALAMASLVAGPIYLLQRVRRT